MSRHVPKSEAAPVDRPSIASMRTYNRSPVRVGRSVGRKTAETHSVLALQSLCRAPSAHTEQMERDVRCRSCATLAPSTHCSPLPQDDFDEEGDEEYEEVRAGGGGEGPVR